MGTQGDAPEPAHTSGRRGEAASHSAPPATTAAPNALDTATERPENSNGHRVAVAVELAKSSRREVYRGTVTTRASLITPFSISVFALRSASRTVEKRPITTRYIVVPASR